MPYYQAGGYAYAAGGMGNYAAGGSFLGGLVKGIGKVVGGVAKTVGGVVGGVPGALLQGAGNLIAPTPASATPIPIMQPPLGLQGLQALQQPTATQRKGGVVAVGVSPLGTVGVKLAKHRHMNAGNAKAARRAIRRIKSVRHLLVSIERELPHKRVTARGGSRGVITAAEARHALRA